MHPLTATPQTIETVTPPTHQSAAASTIRPASKFSSNRDVAVVQADYLALANDLEQAQALASVLEMQLSGKTNELAQFKLIWERTQTDLVKFAQDLDTMRKERHSLANEVQGAYAIEHKYEKLKLAHETLETVHAALQSSHAAFQVTHDTLAVKAERLESDLMRERAIHVQTRVEADELRLKASSRVPTLGLSRDQDLRRSLEALREQLDRVLGGGQAGAAAQVPAAARIEPEHIAIEFCA